jgi:3-oxoacyl-[acyl-carrier protein] reductase
MAESKRTALITGSGRNIGKGIAVELASKGWNIVLNGSRDRAACEAVAKEVAAAGGDSIIEMCDIGDRDAVIAMAEAGIKKFGAVDALVNNAAIRPDGDFLKSGLDHWQRVMDVNFYSALHLARACLPGMVAKGWGRILHFTGMNAQQGYAGKAAVSCSKHALWGLTKSLSKEFGPKGVTTNIISPGTFPDISEDVSAPRYQNLLKNNPVARLGNPTDIAAMVELLCSDRGGFINGQMLQINGGVINQV